MAREPDPQTQLDTLARELEAAKALHRAYLFRGDERFFRDQGARAVAERARALGAEVTRYDESDPDFNLALLMDDLAARPMFAEARCVVVRGAAKLLKKEGKSDAPLTIAVRSFLEGSLEGTIVLDAEGLRADHAVAKAVAKSGGTSITCRKLWDSPPPWAAGDMRKVELVQWLVARARVKGVRLGPDDAAMLASSTGNDLYALDAQLEKLRYAPPSQAASTVKALAGSERSVSPWTIGEQLVQGDVRRAAPGVEQLFRSGFQGRDGTREVDPRALVMVLLNAVRSKVRQALAGARVMAAGGDLAQAAEAAGVGTWPKARAEFEARLRSRPVTAWQGMLSECNALERATRESRSLDANDFFALALRWARPQTQAAQGSGSQGGSRGARSRGASGSRGGWRR